MFFLLVVFGKLGNQTNEPGLRHSLVNTIPTVGGMEWQGLCLDFPEIISLDVTQEHVENIESVFKVEFYIDGYFQGDVESCADINS